MTWPRCPGPTYSCCLSAAILKLALICTASPWTDRQRELTHTDYLMCTHRPAGELYKLGFVIVYGNCNVQYMKL